MGRAAQAWCGVVWFEVHINVCKFLICFLSIDINYAMPSNCSSERFTCDLNVRRGLTESKTQFLCKQWFCSTVFVDVNELHRLLNPKLPKDRGSKIYNLRIAVHFIFKLVNFRS